MATTLHKGFRVLVVDDSPGDRRLAEIELMSAPQEISVSGAETLREAMEILGEYPFDAALLDLGLPDSQGLATVEQFIAFMPEIPVVVLTGNNDHEVGLAAVQAGAQDYLIKGQTGGDALYRALAYAIQRKAQEQRIRESESQQHYILQHSPLGVAVSDEDGNILFVNKRLCELFGMEEHALIGVKAGAFYADPEVRENLLTILRKFGSVDDKEVCLKVPHQEGHFWSLLSMRSTTWQNKPAVLSWIYDISQRKVYEDSLVQSRDEATALAQARNDFVSLISHEIRMPMTGILGTVRMLLDSTLDETQRDWAETINYSGEALVAVLDDVLEFSKIDGGRAELREAPFDLRKAIGSVISLMSSRAEEKGLTLNYRADKALPRLMVGDANLLRQILLKLVGNAIKFTDMGEVVVTVDDAGWDSAGRSIVRVMISDTGPGIRESEIPGLFKGGKTGSAPLTRLHGGGGLGLSISSRLCQLMGGKIGVESALGRGSTFWVELPLQVAERKHHLAFQEDTSDAPKAARSAVEDNPVTSHTPQDFRVLMVDDNLVNRKVVGGLLVRKGYQVCLEEDGLAALEACRREPFDAIIMDIQMPRMDGLEATKAIRGLGGAYAQIPIIALTANVMMEGTSDCADAGMSGFLAKPVKPNILYETVAEQITTWQRMAADQAAKEKRLSEAPGSQAKDVGSDADLSGVINEASFQSLQADLGDVLLQELLEEFLSQSKGLSRQILDILGKNDAVSGGERPSEKVVVNIPLLLRRECHDLRALSMNIGLRELGTVTATLERALADGQGALQSNHLWELRRAIERAETVLKTKISLCSA